jgi:predicted esterase
MFTTKTNAQAAPSGRWRVGGYGVLLCLGLGLASGTQGAALPNELTPVAIGVMQRDAGPMYQVRGEVAENAAQGWRLKFSADRWRSGRRRARRPGC